MSEASPDPLAVWETGRGEPLVLLHGIATDHEVWNAVVREIAGTRRVITPDLPGFGGSAPVGKGFGLDEVARAVHSGLERQGIAPPYDLVGHSLGGAVAIMLAVSFPEAVRRLVLVAPAGLRPLPAGLALVLGAAPAAALRSSVDAALAVRRAAAPLIRRAWGRRLLLSLSVAHADRLDPVTARAIICASAAARRTGPALAALVDARLAPRLAEVRAPLGVIWGEADRTVPIDALADLRGVRPDAQVITLAETGHLPMLEDPHAFRAALETLIDGAGAVRGAAARPPAR